MRDQVLWSAKQFLGLANTAFGAGDQAHHLEPLRIAEYLQQRCVEPPALPTATTWRRTSDDWQVYQNAFDVVLGHLTRVNVAVAPCDDSSARRSRPG